MSEPITLNEKGQDPDTPPPSYAPSNAYAQQQGYAGAGQPYIAQSYVQPQPVQNYGPPQTNIQTTTVTSPPGFHFVQQSAMESPTAKKLNIASAILSGILFGFTILGLIGGPVAVPWYFDTSIMIVTIIGVVGAIFLLIGMIQSCRTAYSNNTNKRAMLIGSIVMYSLSVCMLISWAGIAVILGPWMLFFLIVGFGCLALAIMTGISCSMYGTTLVMYGGGPQSVMIGGGLGAGPGSVVIGGAQPGYGQPRVIGNPDYPGYDQPQSMMVGNPGQPSAVAGNPGQIPAAVGQHGQSQYAY